MLLVIVVVRRLRCCHGRYTYLEVVGDERWQLVVRVVREGDERDARSWRITPNGDAYPHALTSQSSQRRRHRNRPEEEGCAHAPRQTPLNGRVSCSALPLNRHHWLWQLSSASPPPVVTLPAPPPLNRTLLPLTALPFASAWRVGVSGATNGRKGATGAGDSLQELVGSPELPPGVLADGLHDGDR